MTGKRNLAILGLAAIMLAALSGCRSDVITVDPKNPNSPQYPYLAHEFALLQLAVDDVQELEKKKQYGKIYDDYASDDFRRNVTRRQFLVMANCTEQHLGALNEYDDNNFGFSRNQMPAKNKPALDSITRKVLRSKAGQVEEQLVFSSDGIHFKLNGLYWIAEETPFLSCMQQAEKMAAKPHPAPRKPAREPAAAKPAKASETKAKPAASTTDMPDKPASSIKSKPAPQPAMPAGSPPAAD